MPFSVGEGEELGDILQTGEDLTFGRKNLRNGCQEGIYEAITEEYAHKAMRNGSIISSAFVVWQDGSEYRKGRLVVNLAKQSKHWKKGTVEM